MACGEQVDQAEWADCLMKQCRHVYIQGRCLRGGGGCLGKGFVHGRDIVFAAALALATDGGAGVIGLLCRFAKPPLARRLLFDSLPQPPTGLQYEDLS